MRSSLRQLWSSFRARPAHRTPRSARPAVEVLEGRNLMAAGFVQTNLVSDVAGLAITTDPNLINPWGLSASQTSPVWVANNNSGTSTLYNGQGGIVPLVVTIPTATPGSLGSPTGTVANTFGSGFAVAPGKASAFLFDTEDGDVDAWGGGTVATVEVTNPSAGYKGLTFGTDQAGQNLLYAANFAQNTIDVFDANFNEVQGAPGSSAAPSSIHLMGNFSDPSLPAGYAPFNVQALGGKLYVEYAKFDPTTTEGARGAGLGFVDVYSNDGVLLTPHHLIVGGALNAPWGVALAPASFGAFGGDLLVGNFGNGRINAFDPSSGKLLGTLTLTNGQPFQEDNLWALRFGNGAGSGAANTLFFTAGIQNQQHGLYGSLQATTAVTQHAPVLPNLPGTAEQTVATNAPNGDQNPYGVAFVPQDVHNGGKLQAGDLLVSNFNDAGTTANPGGTQGTGTTIQLIGPNGQTSNFFTGPQGLGLTTALGVLKNGFVLVGSVPTDANGNAQQGSLLVLDGNGKVVETLANAKLLDGPWDLTINDQGNFAQVFVSNVLSGTVTRIDLSVPGHGGKPAVLDMVQIASGYAHHTDPNALVVGPTGLAFDAHTGTLYVASTADNAIFAVPNAGSTFRDHGTGTAIVKNDPHLHGPLGLVQAPNGDLIAANGDAINPGGTPNDLVEFDRFGDFVGDFPVDPGNAGAAFGLALSTDGGVLRFAAVDDNPDPSLRNSDTVEIFTLPLRESIELPHHHHGFDERDG